MHVLPRVADGSERGWLLLEVYVTPIQHALLSLQLTVIIIQLACIGHQLSQVLR